MKKIYLILTILSISFNLCAKQKSEEQKESPKWKARYANWFASFENDFLTAKSNWPMTQEQLLNEIENKKSYAKLRKNKYALNTLRMKVNYLDKKLKCLDSIYQKRIFMQEIKNVKRELLKY